MNPPEAEARLRQWIARCDGYVPVVEGIKAFADDVKVLLADMDGLREEHREQMAGAYNNAVRQLKEERAAHAETKAKVDAMREVVEAAKELMLEQYYGALDGKQYCASCHISQDIISAGLGHKPGCSVGELESALAKLKEVAP